jgi:hypothetical protein
MAFPPLGCKNAFALGGGCLASGKVPRIEPVVSSARAASAGEGANTAIVMRAIRGDPICRISAFAVWFHCFVRSVGFFSPSAALRLGVRSPHDSSPRNHRFAPHRIPNDYRAGFRAILCGCGFRVPAKRRGERSASGGDASGSILERYRTILSLGSARCSSPTPASVTRVRSTESVSRFRRPASWFSPNR